MVLGEEIFHDDSSIAEQNLDCDILIKRIEILGVGKLTYLVLRRILR